jgi:hypothetical protein
MKKHILFMIASALVIIGPSLFILAGCHSPEQLKSIVQPVAQMCYQHDICVMRVRDHKGEEFVVKYTFYRILFAHGGYNNIVRVYHSDPTNTNFTPFGDFQLIQAKDADSVQLDFFNSYATALMADTVYDPPDVTLKSQLK